MSCNTELKRNRPKQTQRLTDEQYKAPYKANKVKDYIKKMIEVLIQQESSPQQVVDYLASHKRIAVESARKTQKDISRYLLTIAIIYIILGTIVGSVMYLLEMPNPVL